MKQEPPDRSQTSKPAAQSGAAQTLVASPAKIEWFYAESKAGRWGLSRERFTASLERSTEKRLASGALAPEKLEEYLSTLHLEDLALAAACMENCEPAWEHFVREYRGYLRAAASVQPASNNSNSAMTAVHPMARPVSSAWRISRTPPMCR